jgi:hypothetical protein
LVYLQKSLTILGRFAGTESPLRFPRHASRAVHGELAIVEHLGGGTCKKMTEIELGMVSLEIRGRLVFKGLCGSLRGKTLRFSGEPLRQADAFVAIDCSPLQRMLFAFDAKMTQLGVGLAKFAWSLA